MTFTLAAFERAIRLCGLKYVAPNGPSWVPYPAWIQGERQLSLMPVVGGDSSQLRSSDGKVFDDPEIAWHWLMQGRPVCPWCQHPFADGKTCTYLSCGGPPLGGEEEFSQTDAVLAAAAWSEKQKPTGGVYRDIGVAVGELVDKKNIAYGDSFNVAGEFVKLLWPKGVPPESYGDMLALVRVFDKMKRIATDQDAFGEDPWRDVAGYALLSIERRQRVKGRPATDADLDAEIARLGGIENPEDGGQHDPEPGPLERVWDNKQDAQYDAIPTPAQARWVEEELAGYRLTLEHWVEPEVGVMDGAYEFNWTVGEVELRATLYRGNVLWAAIQDRRPAYLFGSETDGRQKAWAWFLRARGLAQAGESGTAVPVDAPDTNPQDGSPAPPPVPELHPVHVRCQARGGHVPDPRPLAVIDACWGRRKYELSIRQTEPGFEVELTRILDAEGWSPQRVTGDGRTFPPKGRACPRCWAAWSEAEARRQVEAQQEHDRQAAEMEDLARYLRVQGYEAAVRDGEDGPVHVRVALTMGGSARFLVTLGFVRVSPGGGCTSSYAGHGAPDSVIMAKAWSEGKERVDLAVVKFYEQRGQGK